MDAFDDVGTETCRKSVGRVCSHGRNHLDLHETRSERVHRAVEGRRLFRPLARDCQRQRLEEHTDEEGLGRQDLGSGAQHDVRLVESGGDTDEAHDRGVLCEGPEYVLQCHRFAHVCTSRVRIAVDR